MDKMKIVKKQLNFLLVVKSYVQRTGITLAIDNPDSLVWNKDWGYN